MSQVQYYLAHPRFFLLILIVDVVAAVVCLAALCAGESRQHWFRRGLGVCGLLALLIPIRAYEPLLLFLFVLPLLGTLSAWQAAQQDRLLRSASSAKRLWRFGMSTLFQGLTLFGIGLGLWVTALGGEPLLEWPSLPFAAVLLTLFAWRAWQVAANPQRWQNWLKLAGGLIAIMIAESFLLRDWMETCDIFGTTGIRGWRGFPRDVVMVPVLYFPFAVLVILGARLVRAMSSITCEKQARRRYARIVAGALALLVGVPMMWLYFRMLGPSPIPPSSEGEVYRKLVQLGAKMPRATPSEAEKILSEAKRLLREPASVALDYRNGSLGQQNREVEPLHRLDRALVESDRQQLSGKNSEATTFAIASLRLGSMLQRRGTALHTQVGIVYEHRAIHQTSEMRFNLSTKERLAAISALEQSETLRDLVNDIRTRTKVWRDLWERWRYRLNSIVVEESWQDNSDEVDRDLESAYDLVSASNRLLRTDLAIRSFQQDKGRLPSSLMELTPKYLSAPLFDPYSSELLRYLPSGNSFLLYSLGPDRKDNGGRTPTGSQGYEGNDISL